MSTERQFDNLDQYARAMEAANNAAAPPPQLSTPVDTARRCSMIRQDRMHRGPAAGFGLVRRNGPWAVLVCLIGCGHGAQSSTDTHASGAHHHGHSRHQAFPAEQYAARFEEPSRIEWQKPDEVVARLQLRPGMRIADVGAGSGYFAVRFARAVGSEGTVYAADIEPSMLEYMAERARREKLPNLKVVTAGANDPQLPEPVDLIFLCNVWHHIGEADTRRRYAAGLARYLRPGGRVAIVDWERDIDIPIPSPPLSIRLSAKTIIDEFSAGPFILAERPDLLPYQSFLIFQVEAAPEGT